MLQDIKLLLGIEAADTTEDAKINLIINTVTARLKNLMGGIEPPTDLDYIIREVAVVRYNRIGSEGLASHTVEGESLSFAESDFLPYADEIQAYLETLQEGTRGRIRFL